MEGTEYTVSLSTELDGKTITQITLLAMKGDGDGKDDNDNKKKKEEKKSCCKK